MNAKLKGIFFGALSAMSYGTNPLGALYLLKRDIVPTSILFYRFSIAAVILFAIILFMRKISLRVTLRQLFVLMILGALFAISSLSLFSSFMYMEAGIASTILFVYPVMVAAIMVLLYGERLSVVLVCSTIMALVGIALLYQGGNATLSLKGVLLVLLSSLTYAVFIVVVNRTELSVPKLTMTWYVLVFCAITISVFAQFVPGHALQMLTDTPMWLHAAWLAIVPSIVSILAMTIAVKEVGSTTTAVLGALEPLTAVFIGFVVFNEQLTLRLCIGICLILASVILIILQQALSKQKIHEIVSLLSRRQL